MSHEGVAQSHSGLSDWPVCCPCPMLSSVIKNFVLIILSLLCGVVFVFLHSIFIEGGFPVAFEIGHLAWRVSRRVSRLWTSGLNPRAPQTQEHIAGQKTQNRPEISMFNISLAVIHVCIQLYVYSCSMWHYSTGMPTMCIVPVGCRILVACRLTTCGVDHTF